MSVRGGGLRILGINGSVEEMRPPPSVTHSTDQRDPNPPFFTLDSYLRL